MSSAPCRISKSATTATSTTAAAISNVGVASTASTTSSNTAKTAVAATQRTGKRKRSAASQAPRITVEQPVQILTMMQRGMLPRSNKVAEPTEALVASQREVAVQRTAV